MPSCAFLVVLLPHTINKRSNRSSNLFDTFETLLEDLL